MRKMDDCRKFFDVLVVEVLSEIHDEGIRREVEKILVFSLPFQEGMAGSSKYGNNETVVTFLHVSTASEKESKTLRDYY
jgi:hypothetical protein